LLESHSAKFTPDNYNFLLDFIELEVALWVGLMIDLNQLPG
jgi:hypothetical protein